MSESSICVVGTDEIMVYDALRNVVAQALGERDPSIALEDFTVKDVGGDAALVASRVVEALQTPAFLTDRRVVVVRGAQGLSADEVNALVTWMGAPSADTVLVLAVVGAKSHRLVKAAERVLETNVGSNTKKDKVPYATGKFAEYRVSIDAGTVQRVVDALGDDMARVDQIARTLAAIYGSSPLNFGHVAPYLGEAGDVPSWDLTDAIAEGNATNAIVVARRMLDSRGKAALQIVATLSRYYLELARLESSSATNDVEAGELLGKHKFSAGKQLTLAKRLGGARIAQAVHWIAEADLGLKGGVSYGGRDLDTDQDVTELTVIEVLVARLARMSQGARRR